MHETSGENGGRGTPLTFEHIQPYLEQPALRPESIDSGLAPMLATVCTKFARAAAYQQRADEYEQWGNTLAEYVQTNRDDAPISSSLNCAVATHMFYGAQHGMTGAESALGAQLAQPSLWPLGIEGASINISAPEQSAAVLRWIDIGYKTGSADSRLMRFAGHMHLVEESVQSEGESFVAPNFATQYADMLADDFIEGRLTPQMATTYGVQLMRFADPQYHESLATNFLQYWEHLDSVSTHDVPLLASFTVEACASDHVPEDTKNTLLLSLGNYVDSLQGKDAANNIYRILPSAFNNTNNAMVMAAARVAAELGSTQEMQTEIWDQQVLRGVYATLENENVGDAAELIKVLQNDDVWSEAAWLYLRYAANVSDLKPDDFDAIIRPGRTARHNLLDACDRLDWKKIKAGAINFTELYCHGPGSSQVYAGRLDKFLLSAIRYSGDQNKLLSHSNEPMADLLFSMRDKASNENLSSMLEELLIQYGIIPPTLDPRDLEVGPDINDYHLVQNLDKLAQKRLISLGISNARTAIY